MTHGLNKDAFPNQIQVLPDGTLVSAFVSVAVDPATHQNHYTAMVMRSTDRGRSWSAPRRIADMAPIGARDPDTGTPVLDAGFFVHGAVDARGVLCAAWQDASFSGGARDAIAPSRSTDGGQTWLAPTPVNGDLTVPAFSTALAVRQNGTIGMTYYDFRPNTADPATLPTNFWLATSGDGGATWSEQPVGVRLISTRRRGRRSTA